MVFSGTLEVGHDLLHYLAEHHYLSAHHHSHGHHHSVRDHDHPHSHKHTNVSHSQHDAPEPENALPSVLSFFLYTQNPPVFTFRNRLFTAIHINTIADVLKPILLPLTPPPQL